MLEIKAVTAKGNEYQVVSYEDPFPGEVGSKRIYETCAKCSGNGVVSYGNITFETQHASGRVCFDCNGSGKTSFLVSSARGTARRQAKAQTLRNAEAADFAAEAPARAAAELEADHEAALREEARREAKPKGFLGTEGERLRKLDAQVAMIRSWEGESFRGTPELKYLVKFDVLGKTAVWFTTNPGNLEEGDSVSLTGTVKKLETYQGEDQTVLTRCTFTK